MNQLLQEATLPCMMQQVVHGFAHSNGRVECFHCKSVSGGIYSGTEKVIRSMRLTLCLLLVLRTNYLDKARRGRFAFRHLATHCFCIATTHTVNQKSMTFFKSTTYETLFLPTFDGEIQY